MKKPPILLIAILFISLAGCGKGGQKDVSERAANNREAITTESPQPMAKDMKEIATSKISKEKAVETAKADYIKRKGSLKGTDFDVSDDPDGWRIHFYPQVRNGATVGGGSDYLIDKETGKILNLKLHQ